MGGGDGTLSAGDRVGEAVFELVRELGDDMPPSGTGGGLGLVLAPVAQVIPDVLDHQGDGFHSQAEAV